MRADSGLMLDGEDPRYYDSARNVKVQRANRPGTGSEIVDPASTSLPENLAKPKRRHGTVQNQALNWMLFNLISPRRVAREPDTEIGLKGAAAAKTEMFEQIRSLAEDTALEFKSNHHAEQLDLDAKLAELGDVKDPETRRARYKLRASYRLEPRMERDRELGFSSVSESAIQRRHRGRMRLMV